MFFLIALILVVANIPYTFGQQMQTEQVLSSARTTVKQSREQLRDYEKIGNVITKIEADGTSKALPTVTTLQRFQNGKMIANVINGQPKEIRDDKEVDKSGILDVFEQDIYSWSIINSANNEEIALKFVSKNPETSEYKSGVFSLSAETLQLLRCTIIPGTINKKISLPVPGKFNIESMSLSFGSFHNNVVVKAVSTQGKGNMLFTDYNIVMNNEYEYR
jgi:hypothetical protein